MTTGAGSLHGKVAPDTLVSAVLALVRSAEPGCGDTVVVAIDGPSGSGKSTLAKDLSAALDDAPVVRLDDLYDGWDGLAEGIIGLHDQILEPLSQGREAAYQQFDWALGRFTHWHEVPHATVLIVEGAGSSVQPCAVYESVRVWLDADVEARYARGIARDGEDYRHHWQQWARQERAVFAADDPRPRAHLVADTGPG